MTALIRWAAVCRGGDPEAPQRGLTLRAGEQQLSGPGLLRLLLARPGIPTALLCGSRPAAGTLRATTELKVMACDRVRSPA